MYKLGILNFFLEAISVLMDSYYPENSVYLCLFFRSLSPVDAMDILMQTRKNETVKITEMYPQDFKRLFETIECSKDYGYKWLYDDSMEDTVIGN